MTWFKLDDQFHSHPKVICAGNAAVGLYCRLGTYCADKLTDGFIPAAVVKSMGTAKDLRPLLTCPIPDARSLLLAVDGGYQMPDYLEYNPTRESVLAERAKAKERMDKIRGRSGDVRANTTRTNGVGSHVPVPDPVPDPHSSDYISDDDDSVTTPGASSVVDLAHALADNLANLATITTTRKRWVEGTERNILNERRPDLEACIADGLNTDQAIRRLRGIPEPSARDPFGYQPLRRQHANPACPTCLGEGLENVGNNTFARCGCLRDEPYEPPLATVYDIRSASA